MPGNSNTFNVGIVTKPDSSCRRQHGGVFRHIVRLEEIPVLKILCRLYRNRRVELQGVAGAIITCAINIAAVKTGGWPKGRLAADGDEIVYGVGNAAGSDGAPTKDISSYPRHAADVNLVVRGGGFVNAISSDGMPAKDVSGYICRSNGATDVNIVVRGGGSGGSGVVSGAGRRFGIPADDIATRREHPCLLCRR